MNIVIIDDNTAFLEAIVPGLSEKFNVDMFSEAGPGLQFVIDNHIDAVVLDLHMPESNGFQLYEEIRKVKSELPVLFLTGDSEIDSLCKGLELGADDFILKPVPTEELSARIYNRIKLRNPDKETSEIRIKNLTIDLAGCQVILDKKIIRLTPKEYHILVALCQYPNKVIKKDDLVSLLWKDVHVEINNLDTHFSNLRNKLSPFSEHIKTIKNVGYVLRI